jgi:hypothetical protein
LSAQGSDAATAGQEDAPAKADASPGSMRTSFSADCERSSRNALSTIGADMAGLVLANRRAISGLTATLRADLNLIGRIKRFAP